MHLFMAISSLLNLIGCFVFGEKISLREKWKSQIKVGLADGRHLVDIFSTEPRSNVFNQINLMTNFIGTVDSLASFIQAFNPKTEQEMFKELKKTFTDINKKLELTNDNRFGRDFREIYFELRNIDFSFLILNRFLEKLEHIECTSQDECEAGLQWTIKMFKNDFDIEENYWHILKTTINGTRFSKVSLIQQLNETSRCDENAILSFETNLLFKLFKTQQIMVVYGKLADKNNNSVSQIHNWAQDMYEFRSSLLRVVQECSPKKVCKAQCQNGKCVHLSKENLDMCFCQKNYDGNNCQIHNQVILAKDTVAIISFLNQVPKERVKEQIKSATESTCSASITHSLNVHCDQFHLVKNMDIENKCIKGYARKGTRYISCKNITSDCLPCSCNNTGSVSPICNSETGQCQCREDFLGRNCDNEIKQDCKWSDWASWSDCTTACGIGGKQKRSRYIVLSQKGQGTHCEGYKVENRTCFNRCCNGTFECKDSSKCSIGIKCQPCNCDHRGSVSGICQPINGACSCKPKYQGRRCQELKPKDCSGLDKTVYKSGVYTISPDSGSSFQVYCDMETDGGYWTVIQSRLNGKTDFYRGWKEYENGFGDMNAEYWLGNEKINRLTSSGKYQLRINLEDFRGNHAYAKYTNFCVGDASSKYKLTVSGYSGNAGDSLTYHSGRTFSTKDDNRGNCAVGSKGSWWYGGCYYSNLNGQYKGAGYTGVSWYHWKGTYGSIKTSIMMIRIKNM